MRIWLIPGELEVLNLVNCAGIYPRTEDIRVLNIRVRFIGPTRTAAGTSEDTVNISGNTVGDVVDTLADRYGDKFRQEVFQPDGNINKSIKVFINGSGVAPDMPVRDAAVNEGDTVDIFPPFYGG